MHRAIWQQCRFLGFIAEQAERNAIAYAGRSEHATPHIDEHDVDFGVLLGKLQSAFNAHQDERG